MPRLNQGLGISGISDVPAEVINEYLEYKTDEHNQNVRDCYNDLGKTNGFYDGYYELEAKMNGTFIEPIDYFEGYDTALVSCGSLLPPPERIENPLPISTNPWAAAAEIIFTPTELGDGTIQSHIDLRSQDYQASYIDGFGNGMSQSFDDRIEDRFTNDFADPVAVYPAPYDSPVAALDYVAPESSGFDNSSSWSSGGGDDGGSYSGGGDSSGGGGSSGGGSSSSD